MAYARIVTRYTDGTATEIEVGATGEHPDLLDELATRVTRIHTDVVGEEPADEHEAGE